MLCVCVCLCLIHFTWTALWPALAATCFSRQTCSAGLRHQRSLGPITEGWKRRRGGLGLHLHCLRSLHFGFYDTFIDMSF